MLLCLVMKDERTNPLMFRFMCASGEFNFQL